MDKAGKVYWDKQWEQRSLPESIDPHRGDLRNHAVRCFHAEFSWLVQNVTAANPHLLEIGCARSAWLPYFAREFGIRVSGLDYSELGCAQARTMLEKAGVQGEVHFCDFFKPPEALLGAFDVVISFGVAEHFQDTAECLRAFARFLRPGGVMFTLIPNLVGWLGVLQKRLNRPVYDVHVPLSAETLSAAHASAGLTVLKCEYFLDVNWNVVNFEGCHWKRLSRVTVRAFSATTKMQWFLRRWCAVRANERTSPYIICSARKARAEISPPGERRENDGLATV